MFWQAKATTITCPAVLMSTSQAFHAVASWPVVAHDDAIGVSVPKARDMALYDVHKDRISCSIDSHKTCALQNLRWQLVMTQIPTGTPVGTLQRWEGFIRLAATTSLPVCLLCTCKILSSGFCSTYLSIVHTVAQAGFSSRPSHQISQHNISWHEICAENHTESRT